jgi:hypothetical protein
VRLKDYGWVDLGFRFVQTYRARVSTLKWRPVGFRPPGIRRKRDLLNGICKEAAEILKNKHLSLSHFCGR